ncbi:MAG TPA: hypothetical protein PKO33_13000, partial [Pyrinomonadaceae bacterium]|nr:hypothetical protein [Pyrinomonadaceae bacterium]
HRSRPRAGTLTSCAFLHCSVRWSRLKALPGRVGRVRSSSLASASGHAYFVRVSALFGALVTPEGVTRTGRPGAKFIARVRERARLLRARFCIAGYQPRKSAD